MLPADRVLLERLGARLRELREEAKLTQEAVAHKAGFGAKYLGEVEKGTRDVPLSTLRAIVEDGLGYSLDAVFGSMSRRTRRKPSSRLPRDVEMTAELIATLPMTSRRPLLALVRAMQAK